MAGSHSQPAAFVLRNHVYHKRFLPEPSAHAFHYETISLLLDLDALELGRLDIPGLFRYNSIWPNACGVRTSAYFGGGALGLRAKLEKLLNRRVGEVWMHTMPSLCGFEGINPLTVYFVYHPDNGGDKDPPLFDSLVLEVHNTFGEQHVYVLPVDDAESNPNAAEDLSEPQETTSSKYTWTFPRQFHVSPFNDRSGYYRCTLSGVPPAPSSLTHSSPLPKPVVKLDLLTHPEKKRKLVAMITTMRARPLTATSLLAELARAPLALFLTLPRITYEAFILHYVRRLDVFKRPEPLPADPDVKKALGPDPTNPVQPDSEDDGSMMRSLATGFQSETILEKWARQLVTCHFLPLQIERLSFDVHLCSANPAHAPFILRCHSKGTTEDPLKIWYRSSTFFVFLLQSPSPHHALLLGQDVEGTFKVSSREQFVQAFTPPSHTTSPFLSRCTQRLRLLGVPSSVRPEDSSMGLVVPSRSLYLLLVVILSLVLDKVEEIVFRLSGARFIKGTEPWNTWRRISENQVVAPDTGIGSIRRE